MIKGTLSHNSQAPSAPGNQRTGSDHRGLGEGLGEEGGRPWWWARLCREQGGLGTPPPHSRPHPGGVGGTAWFSFIWARRGTFREGNKGSCLRQWASPHGPAPPSRQPHLPVSAERGSCILPKGNLLLQPQSSQWLETENVTRVQLAPCKPRLLPPRPPVPAKCTQGSQHSAAAAFQERFSAWDQCWVFTGALTQDKVVRE